MSCPVPHTSSAYLPPKWASHCCPPPTSPHAFSLYTGVLLEPSFLLSNILALSGLTLVDKTSFFLSMLNFSRAKEVRFLIIFYAPFQKTSLGFHENPWFCTVGSASQLTDKLFKEGYCLTFIYEQTYSLGPIHSQQLTTFCFKIFLVCHCDFCPSSLYCNF